MNKDYINCGDCLLELKAIPDNSIDLIYLDPPFFTQRVHSLNKSNDFYCFTDSWNDLDHYINFINERLEQCFRVLKSTGSIFLHCDTNANHYLRCSLDKIFNYKNFRSEIIWTYRRWSNSKKGLLNAHQTVYWYSKTNNYVFNPQFVDYSLTTNLDQIFQKRVRDSNTNKTIYKKNSNGEAEFNNKKGVPLSDVWEIPYLNPKAKERCGYPTQKPIILLEKIISLTTNIGDIVLDPFAGSGTTLVASKLLNRHYIGFDISDEAVNLSNKRLLNPIKTVSNLLTKGKQAYDNQEEEILDILIQINSQPVQRNKGIDGFLKQQEKILPIPIRIQRKTETLAETKKLTLKSIKHNKYPQAIIIKTKQDTETCHLEIKENENPKITIIDIKDIKNINTKAFNLTI